MEIALRDMGLDTSMISAIHDMLDFIDDTEKPDDPQHPSKTYIRDTKAMRATPADIIEYPNAYHFVVDMPGLKPDQIKVHLEDGNVLVVTGERRREKDDQNAKFIRMERRVGKLLKKFILPENANSEKISAHYQDGVLIVKVEKTPPPEPKKPKLIQVKVGQPEGAEQGRQEAIRTEGSVQQGSEAAGHEEAQATTATTTTDQ